MIGWAFAVSVLLAILSFELVVSRYLSTGGAAAESRRTSDASGHGATFGPASARARSKSDGEPTRLCQDCGTANDAAPAVHYCRNCLARLSEGRTDE